VDPREDETLHRSLRALPAPKAPDTLLPRVMAAVAAADARPSAQAPGTWLTWPLAWQAASIAALAMLVAGLVWIAPSARDAVDASTPGVVSAMGTRIAGAVDGIGAAVRVCSIVWSTYLQPVVGYVLVWIVMMSAACAAFGAALGRVALGGVSH
jgi:hypothetical protein